MANFIKYSDKVEELLQTVEYKVLTTEEFEKIVSGVKEIRGLKSASRYQVKEFLFEKYFTRAQLSGHFSNEIYYKKNEDFDQYDVASTRSRSSFFSHYSALAIHNLTIQVPKQIYLTWERKTLPRNNTGELIQKNVDVVFSKKPRITLDKRKYKSFTINFLNGQNQNRLGVIKFKKYWVSNLERTLIDISVRPFYSGGITQVLQSFEIAKEFLDTKKLFEYYIQMNYIYPYHKIIGFYLEKAGYDLVDYLPFLELESNIDFYLTYNILNKEYNKKWKLFIPKGL